MDSINCCSITIVNMGTGAHKDGAVALLSQRTSEERLAGAGRAVQQHGWHRRDAELPEDFGVAERRHHHPPQLLLRGRAPDHGMEA